MIIDDKLMKQVLDVVGTEPNTLQGLPPRGIHLEVVGIDTPTIEPEEGSTDKAITWARVTTNPSGVLSLGALLRCNDFTFENMPDNESRIKALVRDGFVFYSREKKTSKRNRQYTVYGCQPQTFKKDEVKEEKKSAK